MVISMWMLHDCLEQYVVTHNLDERASIPNLEDVLPLISTQVTYKPLKPEVQDLDSSHLYFVLATGDVTIDLSCYNGGQLVILGGNYTLGAPDSPAYRPPLFMELACGDNALLMANLVAQVFERYRRWHEDLMQVSARGAGCDQLCEIGAHMLGNSLVIFDDEYTVLGAHYAAIHADATGGSIVFKSEGIAGLSIRDVIGLVESPVFRKARSSRGIVTCSPGYSGGYGIVYADIASPEYGRAKVCVFDDVHPHRPGDAQILELFAQFACSYLQTHVSSDDTSSRTFRLAVLSALQGQVIADEELTEVIKIWDWHGGDRFVCAAWDLKSIMGLSSTDDLLKSLVEKTLARSCTVRDGNLQFAVIPLRKGNETAPCDHLGELMRGFLPYLGLSGEFDDFHALRQAGVEARAALQYGARDLGNDATKCRVLEFEDYAMEYFAEKGFSVLPAVRFLDKDVRSLLPYRGKRIDYYETLEAYLRNNMNLLRSSEALCMHRTTLYKRLEKLHEMISADLDDQEVTERMNFSFWVMRMETRLSR